MASRSITSSAVRCAWGRASPSKRIAVSFQGSRISGSFFFAPSIVPRVAIGTGSDRGLGACSKKRRHRPVEVGASSKLFYSISVENHCTGKPRILRRNRFQVLLEVLPPGESLCLIGLDCRFVVVCRLAYYPSLWLRSRFRCGRRK